MAARAMAVEAALPGKRRPCWSGTPEVYFSKTIDNSRLVKVEDPQRGREMRGFGIALGCLFLLVMTFAWQHYAAIEYGYKIQSLKRERDDMVEMNRALRLEDASLRDPGRIDALAKRLGLQSPEAGQVMRMEPDGTEPGSPVLASIAPVAVISPR